MVWTERAKATTSLSPRTTTSGLVRVGDLGLDNPIFAGLSFDDPVPGAGRTLGELAFDDYIRVSIWTERTAEAAAFTPRLQSA